MKNEKLHCRECKKDFTVFVNNKFKFINKFQGLPNCKHHNGSKEKTQRSG